MTYIPEVEYRHRAVECFDALAQDITGATPPILPDRQPYDEPGPFFNLRAGRRLSSSLLANLVEATSEEAYLALVRTGKVVEVPSNLGIHGRTNPVMGLDLTRQVTPREIWWHDPEATDEDGTNLLFKATKNPLNFAKFSSLETVVSVRKFRLPGLEMVRKQPSPQEAAQHLDYLEAARGIFKVITQRHEKQNLGLKTAIR